MIVTTQAENTASQTSYHKEGILWTYSVCWLLCSNSLYACFCLQQIWDHVEVAYLSTKRACLFICPYKVYKLLLKTDKNLLWQGFESNSFVCQVSAEQTKWLIALTIPADKIQFWTWRRFPFAKTYKDAINVSLNSSFPIRKKKKKEKNSQQDVVLISANASKHYCQRDKYKNNSWRQIGSSFVWLYLTQSNKSGNFVVSNCIQFNHH